MTDTELAPGLQATFPFGRLTVAAGQTISSAWGNTTYDQTMEVFASASDRSNQWPAPNEGAQSWLMDSHTPWVYRAGAWHGIPMGYVASAVGPASSTNVSTQVALCSVSVPVVVGRHYRMSCYCYGTQQTATGVVYGTLGGPIDPPLAITRFAVSSALAVNMVLGGTGVFTYTATATGNQTWSTQAFANAGVFVVAANSATILVEDIGS